MGSDKDRVNLYAVVLDCSAPYFLEKNHRYLCTLKLIDATVHPGKGPQEFVSATLFASTAAQMPQPAKVGSVIRIHRGSTNMFREQVQLNCDVSTKSAWVLFDPADGVTPIAHSGKQFTFKAHDETLLKEIRKFAKTYFTKTELSGISLLEAQKKKTDFDVICLVLDVKHKGNTDRLRLCDSEKIVKLDLPTNRTISVLPEEVVRLRGASYSDSGDFTTLTLSEYSNILRVPKDYKSAKDLLTALKGGKAPKALAEEVKMYTRQPGSTAAATTILNSHKQTKTLSLKDLFAGSGKAENKYAKVRVNVIDVGPKDPHEWIWILDSKTKKQ